MRPTTKRIMRKVVDRKDRLIRLAVLAGRNPSNQRLARAVSRDSVGLELMLVRELERLGKQRDLCQPLKSERQKRKANR